MPFIRSSILTLILSSLCQAGFAETPKKVYVDQLKSLVSKNFDRLSLSRSQVKIELESPLFVASEEPHSYAAQVQRVEKLLIEIRELELRQEFWNRLLNQIDAHYSKGDLREFLTATLKQMTLVEALNTQGEVSMWKLLNYLNLAFQSLIDKNEDPLKFIEGYVRASTINRPLSPNEFSTLRDYTNGPVNKTASTVTRENVGEWVESKLGTMAD